MTLGINASRNRTVRILLIGGLRWSLPTMKSLKVCLRTECLIAPWPLLSSLPITHRSVIFIVRRHFNTCGSQSHIYTESSVALSTFRHVSSRILNGKWLRGQDNFTMPPTEHTRNSSPGHSSRVLQLYSILTFIIRFRVYDVRTILSSRVTCASPRTVMLCVHDRESKSLMFIIFFFACEISRNYFVLSGVWPRED